jgi:hypothetical protein
MRLKSVVLIVDEGKIKFHHIYIWYLVYSLNGQVISRIINSYDLLKTAAQLLGICELKYMLTKLTSHVLVY